MCSGLNYNKIREVFEESKYSKREVASNCGFTRPTLDGLLQGADVKVSTLVSWARFFKRPIAYFFDDEVNVISAGRDFVERGNIEHHGTEYNGASVMESDLRDQIQILKSQLADKERIIKLMEESSRTQGEN